jgi:hypothetical protein
MSMHHAVWKAAVSVDLGEVWSAALCHFCCACGDDLCGQARIGRLC